MKKVIFPVLVCFVAAAFFGNAYAGDFQYVGAKKCKICHKKAEDGEQYRIWSESAHAKAYETLASPESIEIGKKVGIDEPQKSDKCLKCHVTGHGEAAEMFGRKYDIAEGVTCEACHGPGSKYKSKKKMIAIYNGELDGATLGLVEPNEETCKKCHNDGSPTFTGFDYEEYVKKIAHPKPKG